MKNKKTLLLFVLLVHVAAWLLLKPVWPFSDDYCYSLKAHNFLEGHSSLTYSQFQNRFGVYVPAAVIFYFFNISPHTIALWPLLASCFTIALVFFFVDKIANKSIAFISALLIALNTLQLTYAIALFPDLIVSFYCIAVVLLLYYAREYKNEHAFYPILLNVVLLFGFLTKETILLIVPFLCIVFIYDLYKKKNRLFWKRTILIGICSVLLQFLMYYSLTGDAFFRIRSLFAFNEGLLNEKVASDIRAMFSSSFLTWINGELGYLFILLIAAGSFLSLKSLTKFHFFIMIYAMVLLLEFIVLYHTNKYGVVFMQDRLWMLIIAPISIVSACMIYRAEERLSIFLLIAFAGLGLYNFSAVSLNRALLFGLFLTATALAYFLKRKHKRANLLLLVPFLALSAYFIYSNSNYRVGSLSSGNLIKEQLEQLNSSEKKIILCEDEFADNHIIYNGFRGYSNLSFFPYSKSDSVMNLPNVYVIINKEETTIPDFIARHPEQWETVVEQDRLFICKKATSQ